jgi:mono/diheme cytochrome c family protein
LLCPVSPIGPVRPVGSAKRADAALLRLLGLCLSRGLAALLLTGLVLTGLGGLAGGPACAQVAAAGAAPASAPEREPAVGLTRRQARTPAAAAAVATSGQRAPDSPEAQGALLYHNYCSVCHGDRGDGRSRATGALSTPPRDFTSAASRQELSRERIVRAVTFGRPGTAMVGWTRQLSAVDIERVADHVWRRFVQGGGAAAGEAAGSAAVSGSQAHGGREVDAAAPAAPSEPSAPMSGLARLNPGHQPLAPVPPSALDPSLGLPLGLQGDPTRGQTFYTANCVPCHGARGDGQGPRAYFITPPPRNFIDPATRWRLNRPLLYASILAGRAGTEMPAWRTVASEQQIADVAEYVFRSFVLGGPRPTGAAASAARP